MTLTRDPSKTFANPFIACTTCGRRVYWYDTATGNDPCGHKGFDRTAQSPVNGGQYVDSWQSVCPSWSPVDGCRCQEHLGKVEHGTPE